MKNKYDDVLAYQRVAALRQLETDWQRQRNDDCRSFPAFLLKQFCPRSHNDEISGFLYAIRGRRLNSRVSRADRVRVSDLADMSLDRSGLEATFYVFHNPFWRLLTNSLSGGDVEDDLWSALHMAFVDFKIGLSARLNRTTEESILLLDATHITSEAAWQILDTLAVFGCLYRTLILRAQALRAGVIEDVLLALLDSDAFRNTFQEDAGLLAKEFVDRALRMRDGWPTGPKKSSSETSRFFAEFMQENSVSWRTQAADSDLTIPSRQISVARCGPSIHQAWAAATGTSLVIRRCRTMPYVRVGQNSLEIVLPREIARDGRKLARDRRRRA